MKILTGDTIEFLVQGRLDSNTSKDFEIEVMNTISDKSNVIFDFKELDYLSSSGLRVILIVQKKINDNGKLIIKNANETIMEIFEITGFSDILTFGD